MNAKDEVKFIGLVESSGEPSRIKIFPEFCIGGLWSAKDAS